MKSIKFLVVAFTFGLFLSNVVNAQVANNNQKELAEVKILTSAKCGDCKSKIETALTKQSGVESASLDLTSKVVTVKYDKNKTSESVLTSAVKDSGYTAEIFNGTTKKSDCGDGAKKSDCGTAKKSDCGGAK